MPLRMQVCQEMLQPMPQPSSPSSNERPTAAKLFLRYSRVLECWDAVSKGTVGDLTPVSPRDAATGPPCAPESYCERTV